MVMKHIKTQKKLKISWLLIFFLIIVNTSSFSQNLNTEQTPKSEEKFKIGMAGYSFVKLDLDKMLETMQALDIHYLCVKDFQLPFNSTDEKIITFHKKLALKGVKCYAVGPIYMKTQEEVDSAFVYAKRVGVKMIVGVPNLELLPYIDKKVKEYDFKYAIHLHGPDLELYPDADDAWQHTKDLDHRMGICLDIGHNLRNGKDPIDALRKYHTRIFDIHIKDVTVASKEGKSIEIGRGIIDYPAFVTALREVNYKGVCSLEHERNMSNPFMGIAESIGYFRAIIKATR